jgi:hypothetical protein
MNSVHSAEMMVSITGSIITRHLCDRVEIGRLAEKYGQCTVVQTGHDDVAGGQFDVSATLDENDRRVYAGLIHRLNSENKLKEKVDNGGKGPDNDGPKPTNPRGSGGKVVEFENTFAIAA